MINNKVWKIEKYEGVFSDEQIITLIKSGKLTGEDALSSKDIKGYIKIKASIYEYYLDKSNKEDNKDETI